MSHGADCEIFLEPLGRKLVAPEGTPLRDLLFEQGVEFPCGGNGRCRGCRIRVVDGNAPVNNVQRDRLSEEELAGGWRLGCQTVVSEALAIELRQWDAAILGDSAKFDFTPQNGIGVAVDLGTTTIVAQLLDLNTGQVIGVRTALNPQARHGADVMSRIQYAVNDLGLPILRDMVRTMIGSLILQLSKLADIAPDKIVRVVVVGNTAMHHLFCGIDVHPLAYYPFEPVDDGLQTFRGGDLGWYMSTDAIVQFLPCLGGFVGSDILAGILATGQHESDKLSLLMDLGTNGETVLGDRTGMLCASAAAGPAFEGARISCGMRASTGAIWKVVATEGQLLCETLGQSDPAGICGSGLVDAIAAGLNLNKISASGRICGGTGVFVLQEPVSLTQADIRQFQLAKGAIAASVRLLLEQLEASFDDVARITLAGAFGNYINRESACRVGLLDFPLHKIEAAGNTALLGAKIALCMPDPVPLMDSIRARTKHVPLNANPRFQDTYVEAMELSEYTNRDTQ